MWVCNNHHIVWGHILITLISLVSCFPRFEENGRWSPKKRRTSILLYMQWNYEPKGATSCKIFHLGFHASFPIYKFDLSIHSLFTYSAICQLIDYYYYAMPYLQSILKQNAISYHLFSFCGSIQNSKIHTDMEIVIFAYAVKKRSRYKSVQV